MFAGSTMFFKWLAEFGKDSTSSCQWQIEENVCLKTEVKPKLSWKLQCHLSSWHHCERMLSAWARAPAFVISGRYCLTTTIAAGVKSC